MKGYESTFLGLFDQDDSHPAISNVEIPIIQRDFAQGRPDDNTTGIRDRFLDALILAVTAGRTQALDFIWGQVQGDGTLRPLDGQQRLTTLFLLHWYVASQAQNLDSESPWLKFSYATRPTARDFCAAIGAHPLPVDSHPSTWITDQSWYVYPWRKDPTIASMLVVLDEIHTRLRGADFSAVWDALSRREDPAIWFLFLPVVDMDYGEDLYIKMNSRGKPLTDFEVLKSDLEEMLKPPVLDPSEHRRLTMNIDNSWSDLLWDYERRSGGDFVTDTEFTNYFTFIVDACEWRDDEADRRWRDKKKLQELPVEARARRAFVESKNAEWNRRFLFHSFDTWVGTDPRETFLSLFVVDSDGTGDLPLFTSSSPDLFGSCISRYSDDFSIADTLMLFAVLLSRGTDVDISGAQLTRRLRTLRNLMNGTFLDRNRMHEYVATIENLILGGSLEGATGFNREWTVDEERKWDLLDGHPALAGALHRLEDNPLLRGGLLSFDLDPAHLDARAEAFTAVTDVRLREALLLALLTKGDYSRSVDWGGHRRQLASSGNEESWRQVLTTGSRSALRRVHDALESLLDDVGERMAAHGASASEALQSIVDSWVSACILRQDFNWRYYVVRYPGARRRQGMGYYHGTYTTDHGYSYSEFRLFHGTSYVAYVSDVILQSAWVQANGFSEGVTEPTWWRSSDPGVKLKQSEITVHSVDHGIQFSVPSRVVESKLRNLLGQQLDEGLLLRVHQIRDGENFVDAEDRVQLVVSVVERLLDAGM